VSSEEMSMTGETKIIRTTTAFDCGGRCPLRLHVKDGRIIRVEGDDAPAPEQLRAVLQVGPATSSFIVIVDEEECTGCGDCIDRCQMEALSMQDDIVAMDADRCFGCGLCISVCPASALRMEPREQRPIPPQDRMELNIAMMASMPRNEALPGEDKE